MLTEKEKAAQGLFYDANYDKELLDERSYCKALCYEYNQLHPSKFEERTDLIRKILGTAKGPFLIEQPFLCDYGYNIEIGKNFFANHYCTILDATCSGTFPGSSALPRPRSRYRIS